MALTEIQKCRIEIADTDLSFPILTDEEYQYFLDKHIGSIMRASLDAARTALMKLSQRTDETVDIFSIRGSKAASEYRLALQLYLNNPNLNPVLLNTSAIISGTSISNMLENDANLDNNIVTTPYREGTTRFPSTAFSINDPFGV